MSEIVIEGVDELKAKLFQAYCKRNNISPFDALANNTLENVCKQESDNAYNKLYFSGKLIAEIVDFAEAESIKA